MTKPNERIKPTLTEHFESVQPSVGFDPGAYEHYLADSALSDAEKHELLTSLWDILSQFVQLGFGVHPVQQATDHQGPCGKPEDQSRIISPALIYSEREKGGAK